MTHLNSEKKMMNSNQESILKQVSVEELCRKLDAYWEGGEKAEAFPYYQKTAEQGESRAQFCLGWCYANGNGVEQDWRQAVSWYRQAEQGHSDAEKGFFQKMLERITRPRGRGGLMR